MGQKFCEKCKQAFEDEGKKWMKVCKPCYAAAKHAEEEQTKADIAKTMPQQKDRFSDVTAGRIARSTALTNAVATAAGSHKALTVYDILEYAQVYEQWILNGTVPQAPVKEEILDIKRNSG